MPARAVETGIGGRGTSSSEGLYGHSWVGTEPEDVDRFIPVYHEHVFHLQWDFGAEPVVLQPDVEVTRPQR